MDYIVLSIAFAALDPVRLAATIVLVSFLPRQWWGWLVGGLLSGLGMALLLDQLNPIRSFEDYAPQSIASSLLVATIFGGGRALLGNLGKQRRARVDTYLEEHGERPLE